MNINEIRMTAANAGSSPINISGSDLLTILNSIPAPASGSQWDDVTGGINYADGNVGINNAAPTVALDVVGAINVSAGIRSCFVDSANEVTIGDITGTTYINILGTDDGSERVFIKAVLKVLIKSTHINLDGLTDYANNAAAITGGLSTGDLYYTNSGGSAVLKIVV